MKRLRHSEHGAVYVEYLLVFPPLLILFLLALQLGLFLAADLGVQHAANVAARAAVVVFPDDGEASYANDPPNQLGPNRSCRQQNGGVAGTLGKIFGGGSSATLRFQCAGGARAGAVHDAAALALLPFATNTFTLAPGGVSDVFVDGLGLPGAIAGKYIYAQAMSAIDYPIEPLSDKMRKPGVEFDYDEPITTRVAFAFHCVVPIAEYFMCEKLFTYEGGLPGALGLEGDLQRKRKSRRRLNAEKAAYRMVKQRGALPRVFQLLLGESILSGRRYRMIRAEATLPLQRANYIYNPPTP